MSFVESLKPNQVFVFGTNRQGFHGAGAAGWAMRGDSRNNWRYDRIFCAALAPLAGMELKTGRWAVLGVARGLMIGKEGMGYGIVTVTRAGQRRSIPIPVLHKEVVEFALFAEKNPQLEFIVTPFGCRLAGYTIAEIKTQIIDTILWPSNVILPEDFK